MTNKTTPSDRKKPQGFSLIEMAMVMAILSAVVGGGLVTVSSMRENQQRKKTNISLEKIREALLWYAVTNNAKLPCPDVGVDTTNSTQTTFDGRQDVDGSGNCRNPVGVLPWQDLGLQPFDNWGNYFTYHVTPEYSQATINCSTADDLTVRKDTDTGTILAENLAAVVVSHGKNGQGHIMPTPAGSPTYITRATVNGMDPNVIGNQTNNEAENADDDAIDTDTHDDTTPIYVQNAGDDMVTYLSPMLLKTKLMESGYDMTSCAPTTTSTSIPTTTTSISTSTTSVSTSTTSVSTSTTSIPTTTTSVSTSTTSIPTTTSISTSTTSIPTTTTSVSTTTTSIPTTTTTTAPPAGLVAGANASCWSLGSGVSISGNNTIYDRRASTLNNANAGCPVIVDPAPSLCYEATFSTTVGLADMDKDHFRFTLNGTACTLGTEPAGGLAINQSKTCFGGSATYNKTTKSIHVFLGSFDTNSMAAGDIKIQYFGDDSSMIFTVSHAIVACSS